MGWAHIPDEKRKALQPKSEKCIFVGYSEDVKGYRLLQSYCSKIIIRRDVKCDENILVCKPNSMFVPSLDCNTNSMFVPSSTYEPSSMFVSSSDLVSYSDDDS